MLKYVHIYVWHLPATNLLFSTLSLSSIGDMYDWQTESYAAQASYA